MKGVVLVLGVLALASCTANSQKKEPNGVRQFENKITLYESKEKGLDSIITNQARDSFDTEYSKARENKAFAQSLSGAWNWKSNRTSVEHAKTSALIGCQRNNMKSEDLYPCKIINVNGEWVE